MKKHLLKTLLTALVLLTGWGSSAWAITITETYDFAGFITTYGQPSMVLGSDVVATQSGTSDFTGGDLYLLKNPSIGENTLELNGRFAIDYGSSAGQQIRFMWRTSSNAYQHGLAGNWNGTGAVNTACHLSVLNLKSGDKITMTWAVQNNKAAQPYLCASGVVTGVAADAFLASGTEYTIAKDGNLDIYFKNNNFAISKIIIVTEKEGDEIMGAPAINVTGVNGKERIITIIPGEGDAGSAATSTYYTLDGSDPSSTNGSAYSTPFAISSTSTIKAVSYLNSAIGTIQSKVVEAGTEIKLNMPTYAISEISEGEGKTYAISSNNSDLLLSPTATYSYTFTPADGSDVEEGEGSSISVSKLGTIVVTASASGYVSSDVVTIVNDTEYEVGESISLKAMDVLAEDDESWTYNSAGTRYANWSGYNGVSKANYPYWTPASDGKGQIGNFNFEPNSNVLMRSVGFIHNTGSANLSITDLAVNTTVKFVVSTYSNNPTNVFVDAVDGTATYAIGAGSSGYAVESVQFYMKVDQALATAKEELLAVITYATSIEALELSDAISTAQTAYDATDATVESVGQAKADLVLAVKQYASGALQTVLELAEEMSGNSGELAEGIQPYKTELDGAIETAKAALNDEEKTPEEIMTALETLSESALVFASVTLDAAIGVAQAIDTEGKNGAEALAAAIQAAEGALEAENPTIQGFYQAGQALKQAIEDFNAANESVFAITDYLVNADFSSTEGWTAYASGNSGTNFQDYSHGFIGTYQVRFSPATVDDTHLSTESCFGFECRWQSNYASFNQETTKELPAGAYTLTFDVENVNGSTTKAAYNNLFYVKVGETTYADNSTEWMNGKSGWTTHTIVFSLAEPAKATVSFGYGTGSNNLHANNTPALYVSHLNLTYSAFANADDYAALNSAISTVEGQLGELSLGFDIGEYAPYNLIEISSALSEAKAIDQDTNNSQADVQGLTETLTNATWAANAEEVNGIWDPSFSYSYSTSGNVKPIAWTGTSGHDNATDVRWMWDSSSNAGLTATTSGKALFTKFGAFYGNQEGYTLPLNENEYYTLSFVYGGWNDCKRDGYVTIADPSNEGINLIPSADLPLDAVDGHQKTSSWKEYQAFFKTNDAGNYTLGLRKKNENQQSQYVYGDFLLKKTTLAEATTYYNGVLDEVDDSYDAEANGGSEKTAFKDAIDASMEGKTVAEILDAAANLYILRDAFVEATANYDAYAAAKSLAEAVDLEYALGSKKTALVEAMAEEPTSSEDAAAKTAALYTALRAYYESNALAEGVEDAVNYNEAVAGANADIKDWTGSIGTNTNEGYTDASGEKSTLYLDGGWSNTTGANIDITREVDVPVGRYLLTVTARGAVNLDTYTLSIGGQSVDLPHIGSGAAVGVFGNGWNDASLEFESYGNPLTLEIKATSTAVEQWMSINRFRLVRIGESEIGNLIAEANELAADDDAVAVGKLRDAIAAYNGGGEIAELAAAVAQFKTDNADQEKDETSKVGTDKEKWTVGTGNNSNRGTYTKNGITLVEHYGESDAGVMISQQVNVDNGLYNIELYATSHNAWNNNGANLQTDADDVAYVFGTSGSNTIKTWITARRNSGMLESEPEVYAVNGLEVNDGKITMGLALERAGQTEWHTIQIKKLTLVTTAKKVYALDKTEMTNLISEANVLAANEYKTEGKDALNTAITAAQTALESNKLNISEFEAEIQALRTAIETFTAANYVAMTGTYYVQNAATGKYMAAGHKWGTQAIVNESGLDMTLAAGADKKVTFDSQVFNGDNNHFLGSSLYMDSPAYAWIIEQTGENEYTIGNGAKYLGADASDNLVLVDEAVTWKFLAAADVQSQRLADGLTSLEAATADNGVDATFLLKDADFNRGDHRWAAWTVSDNCTNQNLGGGCTENNGNGCAESYHSLFTISQTVSNAPAGVYKMTAQGFFRQDDSVTEDCPLFFAGDKTAEIPAMAGSEGNMGDASVSFSNGQYTINPIEFIVGEDGVLTVGIKNETAVHQWVIFDNFQLTYYGPAKTTVTMAVTDAQYATFCAPFDVEIPEGVTAYTIEGEDNGTNVLPMNEVTTGTISANTPVVLYSESAFSKDVEGVAVSAENLNYGWLTGVYEDTPVTAGMYVLQNQKGTVAFYMVGEESTTPDVPAYHAYMTIPSGSEARAYYFGGNATAISALQTLTSGDAEIYDVNGRKQVKLQKGVNIIRTKDGRTQKVMVK